LLSLPTPWLLFFAVGPNFCYSFSLLFLLFILSLTHCVVGLIKTMTYINTAALDHLYLSYCKFSTAFLPCQLDEFNQENGICCCNPILLFKNWFMKVLENQDECTWCVMQPRKPTNHTVLKTQSFFMNAKVSWHDYFYDCSIISYSCLPPRRYHKANFLEFTIVK